MTTTTDDSNLNPTPGPLSSPTVSEVRIARFTGLGYLTLGLAGMATFLVIRSRLFEPDDGAATLANLVADEGLARVGLVVDLLLVGANAVTALLFLALFRRVDVVAAASVAAFGLMNSAAVLVGTMFSGTALWVAVDGADVADRAGTVLTLYQLGDQAWSVGQLFFGLWLIPMGWLVLRSGWMPRVLGSTLMVGGVGYMLSAALGAVFDGVTVLELLVVPATIGEFWIIGYLLVRGVRARA